MPGRGPQSFKKRQKELQRKEKQQEKFAKRQERKQMKGDGPSEPEYGEPLNLTFDDDDIEDSESTTDD